MSRDCFRELYWHFIFWDPEDEDPNLPRAFARVAEVLEVIKKHF